MRMKTKSISKKVSLAMGVACAPLAMVAQGGEFLEEVIVTAQKREQSLQDVPISVSALSAEEILATGTRGFEDIALASPGVFVSGSRDGQAQGITLRGVGSQAFTDTQRPNVAVFIDGVNRQRLDGAFNQSNDLASIEVLKGPQSTLYGKEVSAGAILMNTQKPVLDQVEASVRGSWGSNELEDYGAVLNLPLGDSIAARISLFSAEREGEIKNVLSGGQRSNFENQGGRLRLLWQPTDDFSAIFTYDRNENELEDGLLDRVTYGTWSAGIPKTLPADEYDRKVESVLSQGRDSTNELYYLHLDWTISDSWSLSFIGARNDFERNQVGGSCIPEYTDPVACRPAQAGGDGGYLAAPVLVFGAPSVKDEVDSYELRLNYESENLSSLLGVYYSDYSTDDEGLSVCVLPLVSIPGVAPNGLPLFIGLQFDEQILSIYNHNTYSFNDKWDLVFGLSYSDIDREQSEFSNFFAGAFATPPSFPNEYNIVQDGNWDNVSGTLKAVYAISDDVRAYGGVSTGFRPGGFNAVPAPGFDEETSIAWELGLKGDFLDGRFRLNSALFYQTFDDYQVQTFDLSPGALGNIFTNSGEVEIAGIEADFAWLATDGLLIRGAISYADAEYKKFEGAECNFSQESGLEVGCEQVTTDNGVAFIQDLSGERLANNSPLTGNISAEYRDAFGGGTEWYVRADAIYRDDYFSYTNLEPLSQVDSYTVVNARIGLTAADSTWDVSLWGRNITDEDYLNGMLPGRDGSNKGDGLVGIVAQGATYGIDVRYTYNNAR